ncbi:MAG TPA: protein kinase [Polyangiaceae bacterium]|nr:protein kinase [Polyangiaceae bacterium]
MKVCPRCSEVYPDDSEVCGFDGAALRKEVDSLLGKTIAQRYRLISRVGAGRISIVYLARHVMIDRLSALKILRPHLGKNPTLCDRFLHEARAVNRINHDNIVEITDYGEANGSVYLVMGYVPGDTMRKHLTMGLFPWTRAVRIGIQVASALGRAHQMGIVHRDLNPNNVLLVKKKDGTESVKLIDFGVARMLDAPGTRVDGVSLPGYTAPETLAFGKSDPQSDLYALGALLYEAISGVLPSGVIVGGRPLARSSPPLPLGERVPHLPEGLGRTVMQLLSPRPEHRQRDAFAVLDELTAVRREYAPQEPPTGLTQRPGAADMPASSAAPDVAPQTLRAAEQAVMTRPLPGARRDGSSLLDGAPSGPASSPRSVEGPSSAVYRPLDTNLRPLSELEPHCREGLLRIERAVASYASLPPDASAKLGEVRRLIDTLALAGETIRADQARSAELEARASEVKANFGRALDELGHDLSRANSLVGDLDLRIAKLQKQRESQLTAQVGQRDAWLWEQGALTEEVRRAHAWAEDVTFQITELRKRLDRQTEELDGEIARLRAALEGHVAALRSLARETWSAIEQTAECLAVPLSLVGPKE